MAISNALFSSRRTDWETPDDLFERLDAEFHFTQDACATRTNTKVPGSFITPEEDALTMMWGDVVWCNPPYGRDIGLWMRKARMEAEAGSTVVVLAHARTDTKWWHENVEGLASEVRFIRGRVKFKGGRSRAPFPSAIIVYRPRNV
jgi:phage N-6-adenine-methyltransferase